MISRSVYTVSTGRKLFWAGLGCVALTVVLFFGGFLVGNSFSPEFSMGVLLAGLILSAVTSLVAGIIGVAGIVSFPRLRGRFVLVLLLALLCSPLLWLMSLVLIS